MGPSGLRFFLDPLRKSWTTSRVSQPLSFTRRRTYAAIGMLLDQAPPDGMQLCLGWGISHGSGASHDRTATKW